MALIENFTRENSRRGRIIWRTTDGASDCLTKMSKSADVLADSAECKCASSGCPIRFALRTIKKR